VWNGISISVDGSEDDQVNIKDLEGYDSEKSDPFASSDSSSSVSDSRDDDDNEMTM